MKTELPLFIAIIADIINFILPLLMVWMFYFFSRPNSKPMDFIGIRVGAMVKSEEAWRAGHKAGLNQASSVSDINFWVVPYHSGVKSFYE